MSDSFLQEAQHRLWRLIAWPDGVRAGLDAEPAGRAPLEGLVRGDERLSAETRLDVYASAYFYRIHDVLVEDFPALAQGLSEDVFHDLATSYLAVHPSQHPSLRFIGSRLAGFLETHDAAASFRERFPWAGDMARFEAAHEDVFDAANTAAATRADLGATPPDAWSEIDVRLRPCVRVLDLAWPVHRARHAVLAGDPFPALEPEEVSLCLWRRDEQVVHRELPGAESTALALAATGLSFGALCEQIAAEVGDEEAPARAAAWLGFWVDARLVARPAARA